MDLSARKAIIAGAYTVGADYFTEDSGEYIKCFALGAGSTYVSEKVIHYLNVPKSDIICAIVSGGVYALGKSFITERDESMIKDFLVGAGIDIAASKTQEMIGGGYSYKAVIGSSSVATI